MEGLEIDSIDEAFGRLSRRRAADDRQASLHDWGLALRHQVRQRLGWPVAGGIAATRVLAKLANRIAKRDPAHTGVFDPGEELPAGVGVTLPQGGIKVELCARRNG